MRNVLTIVMSSLITVLVLHWATRADEVTVKNEQEASNLKEAEIQYAQIVIKHVTARLEAIKKETGASDADLAHHPTGNELRLAKAWIAYLNDPTNESPAEVSAEIILESAKTNLNTAKALLARVPNEQSKENLLRCETNVELAHARLAVAKAMRKASPEEKLQWVLTPEFELVVNLGAANLEIMFR